MKISSKVFCYLIVFAMLKSIVYAEVTFDQIKSRKIAQYELTDMMIELAYRDELFLLQRWKDLSPKSFHKLDFTQAYLLAAQRSSKKGDKSKALDFYIKAYQWIDKKHHRGKLEAAYYAAFFLYAQKKRSEALFYINRAIDELEIEGESPLSQDIFYLKRRIVWRYFSRMEAFPDNAISSIAFDSDDVWVGMWSGSVVRYSRSASMLDIFNPRNTKLPSVFIRDILVMPDKVWVATFSGLAYYNKLDATWHNVKKFTKYKLKKVIYSGKYFYVATLFHGVYRSIDGISWDNIIPKKCVLDLLIIDQDLFVATPENGVFLYSNGMLKPFLSNVSAKTMIKDQDDRFIWIGTYGQGLLKVNRHTGKIEKKFTAKEMMSNYIESLLIIDQKLWAGTLETGVSVYDISRNKWTHLGLRDGLPGLDITTITRENDHLWFGTLAGGIGIYLFKEHKPIQGVSLD